MKFLNWNGDGFQGSGQCRGELSTYLHSLRRVQRLLRSFLNGRFSQRRHDFVARIIRMQPVLSQFFLHQALIIDQRGKSFTTEAESG